MTEPNQTQSTETHGHLTQPLSVKQWLGTLALLMIPIANIVLMFYWAFAENVNINKRNYFRANLLLAAIVLGVYIVLLVLVGLFSVFVFHSFS